MALLRVALLGPIGLEAEGRRLRLSAPPMTFPLLGYLLLHRGKSLNRESLAFALWSEYDEADAKLNLRRHLYSLTRLLPPAPKKAPWLLVDAKTVRWNETCPATIDVDEFERALSDGDRAAGADLYAGDLLEGYEGEWILPPRERLRELHVENLLALIAIARSERRPQQAMEYARRLQRCDPWREDALRECVSLRYELGDGAGAIADLDAFANRLRDELDAEMMPETVALREMIARQERRRGAGAPVKPPEPARAWRTFPFVGRTRELDGLQRSWERARRGAGAAVFVTGEAGIGKSRLVTSLATFAAGDGALVLRGAAAFESTPYQPLLDALAPAAATIVQAGVAPIWSAALGALLPELRAGKKLPELPALPPEREQARLYESFVRAIAALTSVRPLLLVIEDVHLCGPATFGLFETLAREAGKQPCLVLLTYRSEEVQRGHPLLASTENLHKAKLLHRVSLGPLAASDVEELFRVLAGGDVEVAEVAALLHRRSGGNPFFLGELVRDGIDRGVLRLEEQRVTYDAKAETRVSSGIREVMKARLQRISPQSRTMLELAAVIGRSFTLDLVRVAAAAREAEAIRALLELSDRQLIAETGGGIYTFLHDLLQSAAYELIPPDQRRSHHLRIAEIVAAAHRARPEDAAELLAVHLERAGEADRAAAWHLTAARRNLKQNANEEACTHCDRVLALTQDRVSRAQALFIREEIHHRRAERDAQRADLAAMESLADASDPDLDLEVLHRRIRVALDAGDRGEVAGLIEKMRERGRALGSPKWSAMADFADGRRFLASGQLEAARAAFERALAVDEFNLDPRSYDACEGLMDVSFHSGDTQAAERDAARALAAASRHGNPDLYLRVSRSRRTLPHNIESPEQTYRISREALQDAIAIGDVHEMTETRLRAGTSAMTLFRISEADEHLRIAEQLAERASTPKWRCNVIISRGVLAYAVGDFDSCFGHLARAKAIALAGGDRFTELLCEVNVASALIVSGEPARGRAMLDAVEALDAEIGSPMMTSVLHCARGSAMWRLGIPEGLAELEAGVRQQRDLGRTSTFGDDLAELALAYVERGEGQAALAVAHELEEIVDTSYCGVTHPQLMLHAASRAYGLAGDHARARELHDRACAWYRKHLDEIDDPDWKRTFAALWFNRALHDEVELPA